MRIRQAADEFLSHSRIAVVGVSNEKDDAANLIYRSLRDLNYTVYPVNPHIQNFEGSMCFPDLYVLEDLVEAVVIVTRPEVTQEIMRQCIDTGISWVWIHRSVGNSVSNLAVVQGRKQGLHVIDGGCPMMYLEPVDFGHKCLRAVCYITGRLPHQVA